jgi:hypothetical protein
MSVVCQSLHFGVGVAKEFLHQILDVTYILELKVNFKISDIYSKISASWKQNFDPLGLLPRCDSLPPPPRQAVVRTYTTKEDAKILIVP